MTSIAAGPLSPRALIAAERVANASRLHASGLSMGQIAKRLNIPVQTVYEDIQSAKAIWISQAANNRQQFVAAELARLDRVEYEAWNQWEKSCRPMVEKRTEEDGPSQQNPNGKTKQSKTTRRKSGDPRLLAVILKCVESRREMLGLDAPQQSAADLERDMAEPMVVEIATRDAARLVMEHSDGRLKVKIDDDSKPNAIKDLDILAPSAVSRESEAVTVRRQPSEPSEPYDAGSAPSDSDPA